MFDFDTIAQRYPGAGTLVKGIQLLEIIARSDGAVTSTYLLRETGLAKATFYRLLGALVEFGYVRHDPVQKNYKLGQRFIELGRHALETFDMRGAAESEVTRLSGELNETVSFAVLDKDMIRHVDVRRPPNPIAVGIEVGRSMAAINSASGQAILSAMPPHKVNEFLQALGEQERASILSDIAISRSRGYTIADSRTLPGVIIIAVPIQGPPNVGYGALVVTAMAPSLPQERRHVIGRDLMEAARRVMGNLGSAPVSITPNPRRTMHVDEDLHCILPAGAVVGEGPSWDVRHGVLRWVDAAAPSIHSFDPATGQATSARMPYLVSAVLPASDGKCVVLSQHGLEHYDPDTHALKPLFDPERHLPGNRFNDAKTDHHGRVWAGTMSLDASMPTGSLYRFDSTHEAKAVDSGFQVSNGLDWSPDRKHFYFVDTALHTVFRYQFDDASGEIGKREVFLQFKPADGKPDGICVDSQGNIWVALWDGWRVACFGPDGKLLREVDMPVPRPTSCCLGGPDRRTLFITSASIRLPASVLAEAPLSGGLFSIEVDVPGQAPAEVRL